MTVNVPVAARCCTDISRTLRVTHHCQRARCCPEARAAAAHIRQEEVVQSLMERLNSSRMQLQPTHDVAIALSE